MTDEAWNEEGPSQAARPAEEMRLRARRPPVMRGCPERSCLASELWRPSASVAPCSSSSKPEHQTGGTELFNTNNRNTPDGLANFRLARLQQASKAGARTRTAAAR